MNEKQYCALSGAAAGDCAKCKLANGAADCAGNPIDDYCSGQNCPCCGGFGEPCDEQEN